MVTLPPCPVETTLLMIDDKWTVLILRDLLTGTKRFGELHTSLSGISKKVLTEKLRKMEELGILERTVYPEIPPKVEYSLTDLGMSLSPILNAMADWGTAYKEKLAALRFRRTSVAVLPRIAEPQSATHSDFCKNPYFRIILTYFYKIVR